MDLRGERGIALVVALMTTMLLMALGAGIVLLTTSETMIAAHFREANEAFYAADLALERAIADLALAPEWDPLLGGDVRSSFSDGPPTGERTLADGSTIDLSQIANMANCQRASTCTDAEMNATHSERPWGVNNPRWKVYAYGRLADSAGAVAITSPYYVIALVADDPSENDGDPAHDGTVAAGVPNRGKGVIVVRAEAFGPRGAHRIVEATVARTEAPATGAADGPLLRVLSWSEGQ